MFNIINSAINALPRLFLSQRKLIHHYLDGYLASGPDAFA